MIMYTANYRSPVGSAHGLLHKDRQFINDVWPSGRHSPLSRQTSPCNKPYMNLEGLDELSSSHTCPGHGCQVFIKFWRAKKKSHKIRRQMPSNAANRICAYIREIFWGKQVHYHRVRWISRRFCSVRDFPCVITVVRGRERPIVFVTIVSELSHG